MLRNFRSVICCLVLCLAANNLSHGQDEETREGDWLHRRDPESGDLVATMRLSLHPQPEPQPALKYQLMAGPFDQLDGNAAIYYLKAMGFLEQSNARNALQDYWDRAREQAQKEERAVSDYPPFSWLEMPLNELPVEEVKAYLNLTSFQPPLLAEAARQRNFSVDRHIRQVDNPVAYLLPEVQSMRELARTQSLRCRVAIAEGRIDDALSILGQQFAMAHHLGQDEFLVSTLVGAACSSIACNDALQLVQKPNAPNLYWAIAALPQPLIDMSQAYAFEREFLLEQIKVLREVDERPRSVGYWQDFIDRLVPQLRGLEVEGLWFANWPGRNDQSTELDRAALTAFIAASYPNAKRYLLETCGMEAGIVEAYPTAQVVFLATVKLHRRATDEFFKWNHVPLWQAQKNEQYRQLNDWIDNELQRLGWASAPVGLLMSAINAARTAQYRVQLTLAMLQTVEAIRMHAARNGGKLPTSLDDLPVPAPLDPFTGQPLDYEYNHRNAVLTGSRTPGYRQRLILEIADSSQAPDNPSTSPSDSLPTGSR